MPIAFIVALRLTVPAAVVLAASSGTRPWCTCAGASAPVAETRR